MGLRMISRRPCSPCAFSRMLHTQMPKHSSPPCPSWLVSGRKLSFESWRVLTLHLLLKGGENLSRDTLKALACSSNVLEINKDKSTDLTSMKVNEDRNCVDSSHDRKKHFNVIDEGVMSACTTSPYDSYLQYNLLMENIYALESSLAGKDLVLLQKEILVHMERLGALESFHASMSRGILMPSSQESDCGLPTENPKYINWETPAEEQNAEVIVRSGKGQERKLKRMRASEKSSGIYMEASSRKSRNVKKSSSQLVAEWKNHPRLRSRVVRNEFVLTKTIKECAKLEKIRENLVKSGLPVSYDTWAEAAGVDMEVLKNTLQAGYRSREQLLVTMEWLVKYIAKTFNGTGAAFDDLLQAGKIGVLNGAEKFDGKRGYRFSTYVRYWIRKSMLPLVAENSRIIQIPARVEGMIREVKEARRVIRSSKGRYPADTEIAAFTGLSFANVRLARKLSRPVVSIYQGIGDGWHAKFVESIQDPSIEAVDEVLFRRQVREQLVLLLLDRLPPRESQVLKLRHGLEDGRCKSLEEVGNVFNVSKEWIRKIEKAAMHKLKEESVQRELKDFYRFLYTQENTA